jgi:hypothetical protein
VQSAPIASLLLNGKNEAGDTPQTQKEPKRGNVFNLTSPASQPRGRLKGLRASSSLFTCLLAQVVIPLLFLLLFLPLDVSDNVESIQDLHRTPGTASKPINEQPILNRSSRNPAVFWSPVPIASWLIRAYSTDSTTHIRPHNLRL